MADIFQDFLKEEANQEDFTNKLNEFVAEKTKDKVDRGLFEKDFRDITKEIPQLQKTFDSKVSKAIETWKENHLGEYKEEIKNELNPPKTEEQKQLAELKQKVEKAENARLLEKARNENYKYIKEKGLTSENSLNFLDSIVTADTEKNKVLIDAYNEAIQQEVANFKEKFLKENGVEVATGQGNNQESEEEYMRKKLQNYYRR